MMAFQKLALDFDKRYHLEELFTIAMLVLLNGLLLARGDVSRAAGVFITNILFIILIALLPFLHRRIRAGWFVYLRDWIILPILITIYMQHNLLIPLINPHDIDDKLIMIDRFLFLGNDPTVLLEPFTYPPVTEILQIVYTSFYFLPFTLCALLYLKGRKIDFHVCASTILLGFYLSYAGYYITPAIGPRFTLSAFQRLPLTGVFTYEYLSALLAVLEGVTRDCFPSGHTLVSVLTVLMAAKYYKPYAKLSAAWAFLLVLSTVYLRYHYVIDLIAGLFIALAVFRWTPALAMKYIFGRDMVREGMASGEAQTSAS